MASDNFMWFPDAAQGGLLISGAAKPEGETQDKWFSKQKAFELKSFSFGCSQAETQGSASTGAGAGKVKFDEFSVEKGVDLGTVPIYQACVAGAHFPTVMIGIRKAGGAGLIYVQFAFAQVFVIGAKHSGGSGEEAPAETITFKYGSMAIRYVQQKSDGTQGTAMEGMWSAVTNSPTFGQGGNPPFISNVTS